MATSPRNIDVSGKDGFVHRLNEDKTFDSICKRCFQTIATVAVERDLALKEENHEKTGCWPVGPTPFIVKKNVKGTRLP